MSSDFLASFRLFLTLRATDTRVKGRVRPASAGRVPSGQLADRSGGCFLPQTPSGQGEGHSGQETVRGLCGGC